MKIFVTGMGIISSLGDNVSENYAALCDAEGGISPLTGIPNMRKPFLGGQIRTTDNQLLSEFGFSGEHTIHRSTLLGLWAAREAWGTRKHDAAVKTGIIFGTTIGGINLGEHVLSNFAHNDATLRMDYSTLHDQNFGTDLIARSIGIKDYKATLSTACSTSANSILVGARLIRANVLDRVLVGGAEAITNYTLNGFDSLMLYDEEICRPFDKKRKGLNLGEGAGFLVLESERAADKNKSHYFAELKGWGNACDAYHQTASSPDGTGAVLAMKQAMRIAHCTPQAIDYINAHGTGTSNNDLSESNALQHVFGNRVPPYSSTKSYTGHTLAAAGSMEAIYSILAIRYQTLFPSLNCMDPINEFSFRPTTKLERNTRIKTVLSNSFGFGGNCTELIFSE